MSLKARVPRTPYGTHWHSFQAWVLVQNGIAQTAEGRERLVGFIDKQRRGKQAGRELAGNAKTEQKKALLINVCFFGGIISLFVLLSFLFLSDLPVKANRVTSPKGNILQLY